MGETRTLEERLAGRPIDRQRALQEIFPDPNGAILIQLENGKRNITATSDCNTREMFVALLQAAQAYGTSLGLTLAWVPTTPDLSDTIVIPDGI